MPGYASLFATLLLAAPILAQEFRASVSGQVTDSTGATVPGAEVAATNVERNTTSNTVSNSAGRYVIEFLPPGHYTLTAAKPGFKKVTHPHVEFGRHASLPIGLAG